MSSELHADLVRLFEAARQRPGAPFDRERFLAFLSEPPAASGRGVRDTFAGRRRFVRFLESVEAHAGICFTNEEWERGLALDDFVDLVARKAADPAATQRLAERRVQAARARTIDEPLKFGVVLLVLLGIPAALGGPGLRAALAGFWLVALAGIATVNLRRRRHYESVLRRAAEATR